MISWAVSGHRDGAVVSVRSDADLELIATLSSFSDDLGVFAVLDRRGVRSEVLALQAGATGIGARDDPPSRLALGAVLAANGVATVPYPLMRRLLGERRATRVAGLTADELRLLRYFASGATAAEIAHASGWSERTIYRKQRRILQKLRAECRSEAIAIAAADGLVTPAGEP